MTSRRPQATAIMLAIWMLWPQQWAAPVTGSAFLWLRQTMASSSASIATVRFEFLPFMRALTPVMPWPAVNSMPSLSSASCTLREVFTSLKPSSGSARMASEIASMSARCAAMASQTFCLMAALSMICTGDRFRRLMAAPAVRSFLYRVIDGTGCARPRRGGGHSVHCRTIVGTRIRRCPRGAASARRARWRRGSCPRRRPWRRGRCARRVA